MRIYAGNLSNDTNEDELKQAFEQFGRVESAEIIKDKFNGQSKGFAFVEMPDSTESQAAVENLNGKDLKGKAITVNEARPRSERSGGGRGFGGGGGYRGSSGNRGGGGPRGGYRNGR